MNKLNILRPGIHTLTLSFTTFDQKGTPHFVKHCSPETYCSDKAKTKEASRLNSR